MNSVITIKQLAKTLSLSNLSSNLESILTNGLEKTNQQFLLELLQAEMALREQRSKERRVKQASLPAIKTLEAFDTAFQTSITSRQLAQLGELTWIESLHNLIFLGPPGVGKTHISLALCSLALDAGYKVFFTSMDRLIHILKTAEISRNSSVRLKYIYTCDLVVVDELGYLPVTRNEANLFFQLLTKLHDKASVVITSNKGFEGWADIFGDTILATAMLDRLTFRCQVIPLSGESYRLTHRSDLFT